MKWNKKNKDRLYELLWLKFRTFKDQYPKGNRLRDAFLHEFGIEKVYKEGQGQHGQVRLWIKFTTHPDGSLYPAVKISTPARNRSHVIILDPWWGGKVPKKPKGLPKGHHYGLSIPKDVAEKFLVLGVP